MALVAAVALPGVMPHLPTRYLVDGLGRATDATGFSDGQLGLDTTDLTRSLNDRSQAPIMSYTTTAPTPTPLRVGVLTTYRGDEWTPDRGSVDFSRQPQAQAARRARRQRPARALRISVDGSRLEAPQIAAPYPLIDGDLDGVPWGLDQTQVARVNRAAESYTMDYVDLRPSREALEQPPRTVQRRRARRRPARGRRLVGGCAGSGRRGGSRRGHADRGRPRHPGALPRHRVHLLPELSGPVRDENGRLAQYDPITHPEDQDGLPRAVRHGHGHARPGQGIPARMAIGFLPGALERGVYTVRAADAHAGLSYFDGVGWLRFEPTPASRSGRPSLLPGGSARPRVRGRADGGSVRVSHDQHR